MESHLTNFVTYDPETHKTDRTRPYVFCSVRLSNLAGRYDPDLTLYETEKCKKGTIAFDGDSCVTNVLYFCLKLKGEERKDIKNFLDINYNYMFTMAVDLILG